MLRFKAPEAQPRSGWHRSCLCEQNLVGHVVERNMRFSWRHLEADPTPLSSVGNLLLCTVQYLELGPQAAKRIWLGLKKKAEVKNWEEERWQKMALN